MRPPRFNAADYRKIGQIANDLASIVIAQEPRHDVRMMAMCEVIAAEIEALPEDKRTAAQNNVITLIDYCRRAHQGTKRGRLVVISAKDEARHG